ncbi:MAG: hypothetical protein GY825_01495, partial [Phycisphaeraceae bacterium]|nr:hypothetical protein [Phycisphaeraceae bacterium]
VDARGPLQEPGLDLGEGDIVLAVNGVDMDLSRDPYAPFVGTAGSTVVLTVADDESETGTRDVVVKTISGEGNLRYRDWIENRRAMVEEMSDGKVGYIYVPNTGRDGQSDLVRQYHGQSHLPALVIDERWNGGGQIPDRFIELLNRPVTNYWATRDSKDWRWPRGVHAGPKAMLINGLAGSGGDMFPWLFRHNDLGPLIGTRTWGGLVGISGNPSLIDGGYTAVPTFGFYEKDGTWGIEGHGVDPDIEVIDDPGLMLDGGDPQLETAVRVMLEALANGEGLQPTERPAGPDRSGMGIAEEDKSSAPDEPPLRQKTAARRLDRRAAFHFRRNRARFEATAQPPIAPAMRPSRISMSVTRPSSTSRRIASIRLTRISIASADAAGS